MFWVDALFLNEHAQLKIKTDKFEDLVKSPLSLILFLNEHAQLKKWFRLKKD